MLIYHIQNQMIGGNNIIIEMIAEGNKIKDILYFNYDNEK